MNFKDEIKKKSIRIYIYLQRHVTKFYNYYLFMCAMF